MTIIKQEDLIESVAAAKDAIAQILTNSHMCAEGKRPICHDTGIVNVFLKISMDVRFEGFKGSIADAINEGVRRGYANPENKLRSSIVAYPLFERKNTKGNTVDVQVAAKGGGSGPAYMEPPSLSDWPDVHWTADTEKSKCINLDTLTKEEVAAWTPGQTLLLNGKMLTERDATHKRTQDMLANGEKLPVNFTNRVIYYVGQVDPVRDEAVGSAGPTTATRMDKFTDMMLEKTGLISMIGKAERGPVAIESIKNHKSAYLIAVDGAATWFPKRSRLQKWSASRISEWKRFTSSTSRICR